MHLIHEQMQVELESGVDGFYFCPHLPTEGCECRKPNLGMIEAAQADFEIDMERSWMIGDKRIDIETGNKANIRTVMVSTGYGTKHRATLQQLPTIFAEDFGAASSEIILSNESMSAPAEIVL